MASSFGTIAASTQMYTKDNVDTLLQRLANGMVYMGTKANKAAIEAVSNPHVGDFYNAADTDVNWCYYETESESYQPTEDTAIVAGKTYYRMSIDPDTDYEPIENPSDAFVGSYFEKVTTKTGHWDKVGGLFSLPQYLTNDSLEDKYLQKTNLATAGVAAGFLTSTDLTPYTRTDGLATWLSSNGYSTEASLNLSTYAKLTDLTSYVTSANLDTAVAAAGYLKEAGVSSLITAAIAGFKNETQLNSWVSEKGYQTANDVSTAISSALTSYTTTANLETAISGLGFTKSSEQSTAVGTINTKLTSLANLDAKPTRSTCELLELYDWVAAIVTALSAS